MTQPAAAAGPAADQSSDATLAAKLALQAGRLLVELREAGADWEPSRLRAEGDRRSHEFLVAQLAQERPSDAVLSEEGVDDPRRLQAARVWIVDPLDGTREYGEPGRTDWAVHVALWSRREDGGGLSAGAITLPARELVLDTGAPPSLAARTPGGAIRVAVSRTRPPALLERLRAGAELEYVPMGSAGAKIAAVLLGEVDAYIHAGGQYEWDSAAPVAVALQAGFHASRIDGSPLTYNAPDPLLPDLLVCRPELAQSLLDGIAATGAATGAR